MQVSAVPAMTLRDERGRVIPMEAGPRLYCGRWVEEGRDIAGAQRPLDPCWHENGDFGCDSSPWAPEDSCGDHIRPFDVIRMDLGYNRDGTRNDSP